MLTPQQFVAQWRGTTLSERSSYQIHFIDLCRMIGHESPGGSGVDSKGKIFAFEYGVKKDSGGQGFADVFYDGHFAIEYKGAHKHKDLKAAYDQLLQYREKLNNPPLLVVCDIENWEIHTNWPNTEKKIYRFTSEEIAQRPSVLRWLQDMFEAPDRLHPRRNTEQITTEAARVFQMIANHMRDWQADPDRIAHFLTKLVFCLFAEDVGLLPAGPKGEVGIFSEIIERTRTEPTRFIRYTEELFRAMADGGEVMFQQIPYFNGALFEDVHVEELVFEALTELEKASALNWASVEPAIFGTLFERSLDPAKRAQLGAHYTSRADILLIVEPVLMQPLQREWEAIKAEAAPIREKYDEALKTSNRRNIQTYESQLQGLRQRMLHRLREQGADPACGSGNFLYVSLGLLMDMEKAVINDEQLADNIRQMDAILNPHPPAPSPLRREGEQDSESPLLAKRGGDLGVGTTLPLTRTSRDLWAAIKPLAREMRKEPTLAEKVLWQQLRKKQVGELRFRRQHPIDKFIADFYCAGARLVVELDGPIHEQQQDYDALRQEFIESLGIRVIRFANDDVLQHTAGVVERIGEVVMEQLDNPHPPTPSPLRREGEQDSESPLLAKRGGDLGVGITEPEWPTVDVIVGNPPFLGGSMMRGELGDYVDRLRAVYEGRVPGGADLVCYWFEKARAHIEQDKAQRAGLLATNSIRGGANREVLKRIKESGDIFMAWSDRDWLLEGAAVRVSMVGFDNGTEQEKRLDGLPVATINPDLTASEDLGVAKQLTENANICFRSDEKGGPFDIEADLAMSMLKAVNKSGLLNSDVVRPYVNGLDITRGSRNMWVIDFGIEMPELQAAQYELPFDYVRRVVKPVRDEVRNDRERAYWWLHRRPAPDMRQAVANLKRFIATP